MRPEEVFEAPPARARYHGPCPVFHEGQTLHVDAQEPEMPEGFCPYAWGAIHPVGWDVVADGQDHEWYARPGKGLVVVACLDGLRPVIFQLKGK